MIISAEHIEQPYDGEYCEKIYDIRSVWNSRDWVWIKFIDESGEWCGEFRGSYKGVSVSKKLGLQMEKYLLISSKAALAPPRLQLTTAAAGFIYTFLPEEKKSLSIKQESVPAEAA